MKSDPDFNRQLKYLQRQLILRKSPKNDESLKIIESSIFKIYNTYKRIYGTFLSNVPTPKKGYKVEQSVFLLDGSF